MEEDLGPQEAIVFLGLALYQAMTGNINLALHRAKVSSMQVSMHEDVLYLLNSCLNQ